MISTILVVDENRPVADTLAEVLRVSDSEFLTFTAYDAQEALQLARGIHPDLVVTAAVMSGVHDLSHALTLRDDYGCKVLLMSAHPQTADLLHRLEEAGKEPFDILPKPTHPFEVIKKIRHLLSLGAALCCAL